MRGLLCVPIASTFLAATMLLSCSVATPEDATLRGLLPALLADGRVPLGRKLQTAQGWAQDRVGTTDWSHVDAVLRQQGLEVLSRSSDEIITTLPGAVVRVSKYDLTFQLIMTSAPEWAKGLGQVLVDARLTMDKRSRRSDVERVFGGGHVVPLGLVFRSRAYKENTNRLPFVKALVVSHTTAFNLGQWPWNGTVGFHVDVVLSSEDQKRDINLSFFVWDPRNPTVTALVSPDDSEAIDGWRVESFGVGETHWR